MLSLSFAFVPLVSSVFLSFVLASSLDMSFFFAHPWPSSLPVLLLSLPRSFLPRRFSRFFYLLLDFFFVRVYDACVPQDHVLRSIVQTNREPTGWPFNPLEPRSPFSLFACRFPRSSSRYNAHRASCLSFSFSSGTIRRCCLHRTCPVAVFVVHTSVNKPLIGLTPI